MSYNNISAALGLENIIIVEDSGDHEPIRKTWGAIKGQRGPNTGTKWSDKARKTRSLLYKGRVSPRKGIPCSDEDKLKKSLSLKGRPKTEEHNKKNSAACKLRYKIPLPDGKWKWGRRDSTMY